jgi:DNA polymerase III delta subunit
MAIYLLIGQNISLIEKKIKELSACFVTLIYNNKFRDFLLELQKIHSQSLFGVKKDIVLKKIDKLKNDEILSLIEVLKTHQKTNFILVFASEPTEFSTLLRKNKLKYHIFHLQPPVKRNFEEFIRNYLQEKRIHLSPEIIKFLKENYQENFDFLLADLEKISLLGNKVNNDELKKLLRFQTNVFKIQDYFLEKNWLLFIHHFKKFIFEDKSFSKIETLKILSLLFNSLMKIYLIKTNKLNKIKANDYYLQKLREKSKNLTIEEIKLLISTLAKTDKKFKKFYINIKEIPEDIVVNYLMSVRNNKNIDLRI